MPVRFADGSHFGCWYVAVLTLLIALAGSVTGGAQSPRPNLEQGPVDAPVTILVFSDFQCPFCARLAPVLKRLMETNPRELRIVFKNFPLAIHPDALSAHEAALAVAGGGRFWEMHDLLFANQSRLARKDLIEYGGRLKVDAGAISDAVDRRVFKELIERDIQDGRDLGVDATPTLFVNGQKVVGARSYEALQAVIDEQLGRSTTNSVAALSPPQFDLSRSPFRGSPAAPITIVEFSDLQCPFCRQVSPVIEEVLGRFPGKVRWVFKHFPLPMHQDAPLAHEAVLAAGEQGRFWEMHDAIFGHQHAMKRTDLLDLARGLGLQVDRFTGDLDGGRFKAVVEQDRQEGERAGVSGTPTFFINGTRLSGALPAAEFARVIDKELALLPTDAKPTTAR
jgi:protein-disulfide isomerase